MEIHSLQSQITSQILTELNGRRTHNDMVDTAALEHVGYELGSDWCPGLVFLVLSCIREVGKLS